MKTYLRSVERIYDKNEGYTSNVSCEIFLFSPCRFSRLSLHVNGLLTLKPWDACTRKMQFVCGTCHLRVHENVKLSWRHYVYTSIVRIEICKYIRNDIVICVISILLIPRRLFLPDYCENTAGVFDVSQEHTIMSHYSGYSNFPGHDSVQKDIKEIFSFIDKVISGMNWQ